MKPKTNYPTNPTIGIEEAAEILRCGYDTVRTAIECGDLPALQMKKRHTVLLREDVIEYVRVHARRQAQERKAEHALREARYKALAPQRRGPGRRRTPPDLTPYEIAAGILPKQMREHDGQQAEASGTPAVVPRKGGRKRRPPPRLDEYERSRP